ncbi:hypothetical protein BDN72DRAFT_776924 [Pluteus cervinus]|uniref:Uncharacterized protein n=1 Tax=Pluteus cervinus TaxID=181527 RepID=A0ACD3A9N0_9AGAR|nr:hypothetical protein BDN72DRAFT_776924 [Pluteus cervinus]
MRLFLTTLLVLAAAALAVPLALQLEQTDDSQLALIESHHDAPSSGGNDTSKPDVPLDTSAGWVDPRILGGRFLDFVNKTHGEPLNVIISGLSDPFILSEDGLHIYAKSLGYSEECLGLHYGNRHLADLGDGDGRKVEQYLARQYYFPVWGTCWESLAGGQHFRAWKQDGELANTGAWFLGCDSTKHHTIVPNGYDLGRDWLIGRATAGTSYRGLGWKADVELRVGLSTPGNTSVNHGIPTDGIVAILTINRL